MPGSASARLVISHSSALAGLGRATNASCLLAEPLCVGSPGRGDFSVSPQRATVTSHSTFAAKAATTHRVRINTLALAARLPTMHDYREYVEAGGLMSYGPNFRDLFRRSADYVDKILRGTKPGDIPVEQPTKFDLVVSITTAKALGLAMPDKVLAIADEVIE